MAITALGGLVVSHSIRVGGYDLDEAIVRFCQDEHRLLIGQEQAEALKIEIGAALPGGDTTQSAAVAGRDLSTGLLRRATISDSEVQRALERPLAAIVDAVKLVLERTPAELAGDVAAHGLMFAGGGALLRRFDQLLQQETGLRVAISDDPLTTVARGAGRALEQPPPRRRAAKNSRRQRRSSP
jgi:rod shape-determining protein MreB